MRKISLLTLFVLLCISINGQILNAGFDTLRSDCEIYCPQTDTFINLCSECGIVVAADNCIDAMAVSLCTMDGFSTTTCGFTPDGFENGFCGPLNGATISSNLWIAFKPITSGRLHLSIEVVNCLSQNTSCSGIQAGLIRGECGIPDSETQFLDCVNCVDQTFDLITVGAVARATHFLMIDACCEDICEIIIHVIDGGENTNDWLATPVSGTLCPNILDPDCNENSIPGIMSLTDIFPTLNNSEFTFDWINADGTMVKSETISYDGNNQVQSTSEGICEPGTYTVEIFNSENCCMSSESIELILEEPTPAQIETETSIFDCGITELTLVGSSTDTDFIPIAQNWWKVDYSTMPPSLIAIPESYGSLTNTLTIVQGDPNTGAGDYLFITFETASVCISEALITIEEGQGLEGPMAMIATPEILDCDNVDGIPLDASTSTLNGNNVSILWTTDNGSVIGDANTLMPTIFAIGEYTLILTNEENGCSNSASVTVVDGGVNISYEIMPHPSNTIFSCRPIFVVYEIIFDDSNNYEFTWRDLNGDIVATGSTYSPAQIMSLPGSLTILDLDSNCSVQETFNYVQDIEIPNLVFPDPIFLDCFTPFVTLPSDDNYTIEWFFMGMLADDNQAFEPGIYDGVVTNEDNGCTSMTSIAVLLDDSALNITVDFSDPTCSDSEDGTITVSVFGGVEPYTYAWSDPIADSTGASLSMLPGGQYIVTVTDSLGCESTVTIDLNTPVAIIYSVLENQDGNLEVFVPQFGGPYTFLWSTGDTTSILEDPFQGQLYQVTVTDGHGCTSVAEGQLITSAENLFELESSIYVYPNPTSEVVYIDYRELQIKSTTITIYTAIGQKIGSLEKEAQLTSLDLKPYPDGIYFLEIKTDIGTVVKRIIKSRHK